MKLFAFARRARGRPSSPPAVPNLPVLAAPEDAASASAEKRRRRPSSSGSAAWKPTLVPISEDAAVTAARVAADKAKAKPKEKAKAKARPPLPPARTDYDDFRRFGAPTVLPAFAPTAFLF